MTKARQILGLNARQQMFKSLNSGRAMRVCNSKLLTKEVLSEAGVLVPELYATFDSMEQVREYDFGKIETSFVVKPSAGSGGKGILIIRKKLPQKDRWLGVDGRELSADDIRLHVNDILEGQYSTFGVTHEAFVEERVPRHTAFKRYSYRGTPDVRVIVYNSVPVMAMLRLPTEESEGRANLHQGAIGVGIDIASGVTLQGVRKGKKVRFVPGSQRKLNGLKIPKWLSVLKTSVAAADAAGLMYGGIDILLHKDKGPMVVELNQSPGLGIQIANMAGLKWRLDRIEGLAIRDSEHGVKVGRVLFAESFADKVKADEGLVILDNFEDIEVKDGEGKKQKIAAMMNTGLYRSQIERSEAEKLGLMNETNVLWERKRGASKQIVIGASLYISGKRVSTGLSVVNKLRKREKIMIGRLDLQGFVVNPRLKKDS